MGARLARLPHAALTRTELAFEHRSQAVLLLALAAVVRVAIGLLNEGEADAEL